MNTSSIEKENFDWKTYLRKYKDIKNIDNEESAWNHWVNKGKKQGRKFYTLTPDENNNFFILTKEYKNRKNSESRKYNVSCLSEDFVIADYVNDLKKKIHKVRKNQTLLKESENKILLTENKLKLNENKVNLNETKSKTKTKINENKVNLNQTKSKTILSENKANLNENNNKLTNNAVQKKKNLREEWSSNNSENSDIFFIETNKDENWDNDSEKSELFFYKSQNNSDFLSDENEKIKLNDKTIKIIEEEQLNN